MSHRRGTPHTHTSCTSGSCSSHAAHVPSQEACDVVELPDGKGARTAMRIMQMDCPTEESLIRKKLDGMGDVYDVQFNLMQRILTVHHAQGGLPAIVQALRSLGFEPEIARQGSRLNTTEPPEQASRSAWWLGVALIIALAAELNSLVQGPAWLSMGAAVLAIALSGITTYKKGLVAITHRNLNINALMSIAVTGAFILGEWPEAAMVMVLFAIAEAIEARSLDRARRSVENLVAVAPEHVSVQQPDGHWHEIPVSSVSLDAIVRVRPGERIGLDGIVTKGMSEVNQAPITGESTLVAKSAGDDVYAGTINGMGEMLYRVTAVADHTMLARIIHTVHDAQAKKAPTQRFIDRFARVYTPIVCAIALGVALFPPLFLGGQWADWIYKALVLLVIACPCALVISTPVAVVGALGAAARLGILIKGGVYLEQGRHLTWLALDKTGTLTTGQPQQLELQALQPDVSAEMCQRIASSMALRSDHPVSHAIAAAAKQPLSTPHQHGTGALDTFENRDPVDSAGAVDTIPAFSAMVVEGFEAVPGCGTQAIVQGQRYYLGKPDWIKTRVASAESATTDADIQAIQSRGQTVTLLADDHRILALFVVVDTVRDTAAQAITELHQLGVRTAMLSGDNLASARYVAGQVGVDIVHGGLLPHEKLTHLEQFMQKGRTGMVGDGINDAPALARADIGFAMGVMGTDTAIETADVALMDDDLRKVARFIRLSRSTYRVLVQNITIALGLKAVFLVMAVLGMATMWMAVFADVGASLIVLANSLRLFRPSQ